MIELRQFAKVVAWGIYVSQVQIKNDPKRDLINNAVEKLLTLQDTKITGYVQEIKKAQ